MRQRYRQPHQLVPYQVALCADAMGKTLEVSGFRQVRSYTCGYAVTATVLDYFGEYIPAAQLFRRLGTGRDGTRQNAIVRELRSQGIRASVRYDVGFDRVCHEVDRDKLIISYLADAEHWVVVYGYGEESRSRLRRGSSAQKSYVTINGMSMALGSISLGSSVLGLGQNPWFQTIFVLLQGWRKSLDSFHFSFDDR